LLIFPSFCFSSELTCERIMRINHTRQAGSAAGAARCALATSLVSVDRHCDRFCSALPADSVESPIQHKLGESILLKGQVVKREFFSLILHQDQK